VLAASAVDTVALGPDWLDPTNVVETFGAYAFLAVVLVIFAECGLLIGFFLPGDSLLFTAGLFAARGNLSFPVILVGCVLAAIAGDQTGYAMGAAVGPTLLRRPPSRFWRPAYVERAERFFDRYGAKTILLARFVPIVRTFAPIIAGISRMRYRTFVTFNVVGGAVWAAGVTTLGFLLGKRFPGLADNLIYVSVVIVVISLVPIAFEYRRHRRVRASEATEPRGA
jgi:membrane-associated protein